MPQQAINTTVTEFVTLEATSCCACGVAFAIPKAMLAALRESHDRFYCPSGHHLAFDGETEAQRLRKQLEQRDRAIQFEREMKEAARAERDKVSRSNVALRGVVKRVKNRSVAGVCPVGGCQRHFVNLERHIGTKHPGYRAQDVG